MARQTSKSGVAGAFPPWHDPSTLNRYEQLQFLTDEVKRLRRVNSQQAQGWKRTNEVLKYTQRKLEDAEIYIKVLEDERRKSNGEVQE